MAEESCGVKLIKNFSELKTEAKKMMGKILVTIKLALKAKRLKDYILKKLQIFQKILSILPN